MLLYFSIVAAGGIEVIKHKSENLDSLQIGSDIFSGFLEAIQMYSEMMGKPVKKIQLGDLILYIRTFGDFSIRIITNIEIKEQKISNIFDNIAEKCMKDIPKIKAGMTYSDKYFSDNYLPILKSLNDPNDLMPKERVFANEEINKIIIAGLANAGKTTIKRIFFEKWNKEMLDSIGPTLGLEITKNELGFIDKKFVIMDLGGQILYRDRHLSNKQIWSKIVTLIYIVDIQDKDYFIESKKYLNQIISLIKNSDENLPNISIFFHKFDPNLKSELKENLKLAFDIFSDFNDISYYYLTSIEDLTSNKAIIKTLYFIIPEAILKRMFEEDFLDVLNERVFPRYNFLLTHQDLSIEELDEIAVMIGMDLGLSLQESWLSFIAGNYKLKNRFLSESRALEVNRNGNFLEIKIYLWPFEKYSKSFVISMLDGVMKGISITFQFSPPEKSFSTREKNLTELIWKLKIS